jgi:hypothetical protein
MLDRFNPQSAQFDPVFVAFAGLVALLFLWVLVTGVQVRSLKKKYRSLLTGVSGMDLEGVLSEYLEMARDAQSQSVRASAEMEAMAKVMQGCVQRSAVVRFDAFTDVGGRQSFSLALMDEPGNGLVLTSVYGREGCRVYAKALREGASDVPLSEEERQAVQQAFSETKLVSRESK